MAIIKLTNWIIYFFSFELRPTGVIASGVITIVNLIGAMVAPGRCNMAKKNKEISWTSIENGLRKYCQDVMSKAAGIVRDELTEEARSAIEDFYNDYSPVSYIRHYWNFYNNSFKPLYQNSHGKKYTGGIRLTPSMLSDIYQDPAQQVFDTVYAGFHGVSSMYVSPKSFSITPRMTPSPMERLIKKREYILSHQGEYVNLAKKMVGYKIELR